MAQQQIEVAFTGNLAAEPEVKTLEGGLTLVEFRVLVTPRVKIKGEWGDAPVSAFRCTAWRDLAENIGATFTKGMRVHVKGTMREETFTRKKDGTEGRSMVVDVQHAFPSLDYATAQVMRRDRPSGQGGGQRQQEAPPQQSDPWATAQPGGGGIPQAEANSGEWGAPSDYKGDVPW